MKTNICKENTYEIRNGEMFVRSKMSDPPIAILKEKRILHSWLPDEVSSALKKFVGATYMRDGDPAVFFIISNDKGDNFHPVRHFIPFVGGQYLAVLEEAIGDAMTSPDERY